MRKSENLTKKTGDESMENKVSSPVRLLQKGSSVTVLRVLEKKNMWICDPTLEEENFGSAITVTFVGDSNVQVSKFGGSALDAENDILEVIEIARRVAECYEAMLKNGTDGAEDEGGDDDRHSFLM
eukprot:TRINITY_DN24605_c0_g1_i1.p2 TRINITY_DN24605_c0_g1~~TRINITY_DN24605_c0_g1_i1.p2  ORF type:complete len:126 (-),score=15.79 TRINITY_DN24605_c0_g1_i1:135-512(-)